MPGLDATECGGNQQDLQGLVVTAHRWRCYQPLKKLLQLIESASELR